MAPLSTPPRTGRDVLPRIKRRRSQPEPLPEPPEIVLVQRPDHEAREWADLALATATDLEEELADERAAHDATRARLDEQCRATGTALEQAKASDTLQRLATAELAKERLARRAAVERAESAERELTAVRRSLGKELADRDLALAGLTARLESSNTAMHRHADQRNRAVLDNHMLKEQVKLLKNRLDRVRETARDAARDLANR